MKTSDVVNIQPLQVELMHLTAVCMCVCMCVSVCQVLQDLGMSISLDLYRPFRTFC